MLELNAPVIVTLEITNQCKYGDCPSCPKDIGNSSSHLTATQWEKVINALDEYVQEYRISGGEPMDHPQLEDIINILEKTDKFYHIFTNGMWENPDAILEILMKGAHINSITFSLHGQNAKVHGKFTKNESEEEFEKLLENIRLTYATGYNVNTNTVITKYNIDHLEEIADLSAQLGAQYSIFSRFIGKEKDVSPTPEKLLEALKKLDTLKSEGYNILIGNCFPHCFFPSSSAGCPAGTTYGAIDWAGNVKPCEYSDLTVGNILKEPIKKIWKSKSLRQWRKKIPKECKRCSKISVCPGGCRLMAEYEGTVQDPLIKEAIPKPKSPRVLDVTLEENLCPKPRYILREEDFGWILIRSGQVIPVSYRAEKILRSIDGATTLGEIQKKFGSGALSFIYSLYVRDFVEFRVKSEPTV